MERYLLAPHFDSSLPFSRGLILSSPPNLLYSQTQIPDIQLHPRRKRGRPTTHNLTRDSALEHGHVFLPRDLPAPLARAARLHSMHMVLGELAQPSYFVTSVSRRLTRPRCSTRVCCSVMMSTPLRGLAPGCAHGRGAHATWTW